MDRLEWPDTVTVENIKLVLDHIESIKDDDERAHTTEDSLYFWVLNAIAEGTCNTEECAGKCLESQLIKFARWCA